MARSKKFFEAENRPKPYLSSHLKRESVLPDSELYLRKNL